MQLPNDAHNISNVRRRRLLLSARHSPREYFSASGNVLSTAMLVTGLGLGTTAFSN